MANDDGYYVLKSNKNLYIPTLSQTRSIFPSKKRICFTGEEMRSNSEKTAVIDGQRVRG